MTYVYAPPLWVVIRTCFCDRCRSNIPSMACCLSFPITARCAQTRPGIKLFVTCGIASACDVRVSTRNCNIRHVTCIVPHLAQVMQFLPSGASRCVIVATIMVRSSYRPHRLAQPHQRLSSLPQESTAAQERASLEPHSRLSCSFSASPEQPGVRRP